MGFAVADEVFTPFFGTEAHVERAKNVDVRGKKWGLGLPPAAANSTATPQNYNSQNASHSRIGHSLYQLLFAALCKWNIGQENEASPLYPA